MAQSQDVEVALARLEQLRAVHLDVAKRMLAAYGGTWYGLDFLASAAIKRSLALLSGFQMMIRERNLVCAGALLRLEIDTAIRFYAAFIVSDPHEFAISVLNGARIDKLKDRCGKELKDAHLVDLLAPDYPWLKRVYRETSGYVHLSTKHVMGILTPTDAEARECELIISAEDKKLPDELYIEAVDAFIETTAILFKYLEGWVFTKANPEVVERMKRRRNSTKSAGDTSCAQP